MEEVKKKGLADLAKNIKAPKMPEKKEMAMAKPTSTDKPWYKTETGQQALIGAVPTLLGAAFGGARGGAIGAKVGLKGLSEMRASKKAQMEKSERTAKEEAALGLKQSEIEATADYRKKYLSIQQQKVNLTRDKQLMKERGETSMSKRLASLGGEEKKRFDNVIMGKKSVNDMMTALGAGENTFSIIGDNRYTFAKEQWNEALGRMQSGGAINDQERKAFANLVPTAMDSREMQARKLTQMGDLMSQRLGTLGFQPQEIEGFTQPEFAQTAEQYALDAPTGLNEAAAARRGYIQKMPDEMSDEELMRELGE